MKTLSERLQTPMPEAIAKLPRDVRGYPIPYLVTIRGGKPDFTTQDPGAWMTCVKEARCHICGEPIKDKGWICGDETALTSPIFSDPPMHYDCMMYSIRVCPFLANPSAKHKNSCPEGTIKVHDYATLEKELRPHPSLILLGFTAYEIVNAVTSTGTHAMIQPLHISDVGIVDVTNPDDWQIMPVGDISPEGLAAIAKANAVALGHKEETPQ